MKRYGGVSIWGALWRGLIPARFKKDPEPWPYKAGAPITAPSDYPEFSVQYQAAYNPISSALELANFLTITPGFQVFVETLSGKAQVMGIKGVDGEKGIIILKTNGGS